MNERNQGHEDLLQDLETLLEQAKAYQFHDFRNEDYAMPKVELVKKLDAIASQTKSGKYDN